MGDDDDAVNKQLLAADERGLENNTLALGDTAEDRRMRRSEHVVLEQLAKGLSGYTVDKIAKMKIAYEPRYAIRGPDFLQEADPKEAQFLAERIRDWISFHKGSEVALKVRILFGGSVSEKNVRQYTALPGFDGFLVGGNSASLDTFEPIIEATIEAGPKDGRIPVVDGNLKTYDVKHPYADILKALAKYGPSQIEIGLLPQLSDIKEAADALREAQQPATAAMVATREERLKYNQEAYKQYTANVQAVAESKAKTVLSSILPLVGYRPNTEITTQSALITSSEGVPQTTGLDSNGEVKLLGSFEALQLGTGTNKEVSVVFAPGHPGVVAQQLTIFLPTNANFKADQLGKALNRVDGLAVKDLEYSSALSRDEKNIVIDSNRISIVKENGLTKIKLILWYKANTAEFRKNVHEDNREIIEGLETLQGSRNEPSRTRKLKPTGRPKNLFIMGGGGRIGSLTLRQYLMAGPDSNINLLLENGTNGDALIDTLRGDSTHGGILNGDRVIGGKKDGDWIQKGRGNDGVEYVEIHYNGHTFNRINLIDVRGDIADLPLEQYGIDIAVDAVTGQRKSVLDRYLQAGAKTVINTSPSKDDETGTVFPAVFGVTAQNMSGNPLVQNTSCTTCSVGAPLNAANQEGGWDAKEMRDVMDARKRSVGETPSESEDFSNPSVDILSFHSSTGSDNTVHANAGPGALNNFRSETSGASKALAKVLPQLDPNKIGVNVIRYPGADMSLSDVLEVVPVAEGKTLTVDDMKRRFIQAENSPLFKGSMDLIADENGGLNSDQLKGSSALWDCSIG